MITRQPASLPMWLKRVDSLLSMASKMASSLRALTPTNAHAEHIRMRDALTAGQSVRPTWTYEPLMDSATGNALVFAEREIKHANSHPLADLYLARIEELALETQMAAAAGTRRLGELAKSRYPQEACARPAISGPVEPELSPQLIETEARVPSSLRSQIERLVGLHTLPFRVAPSTTLLALAATGDDVVWYAPHRKTTARVAERTALHEVVGHAMPRTLAKHLPFGIAMFGTARGHDDQEGYAIVLEEEHGLLDERRARELALRFEAVDRMRDGADFAETVAFACESGVSPVEALALAERIFRGSDGSFAGAGRECVYWPRYLAVKSRLAAKPHLRKMLESGQFSLDSASIVESCLMGDFT